MRTIGGPEIVGSFRFAVGLLTYLETHYLRRFDQPLPLQGTEDGALGYITVIGVNNLQGKLTRA